MQHAHILYESNTPEASECAFDAEQKGDYITNDYYKRRMCA